MAVADKGPIFELLFRHEVLLLGSPGAANVIGGESAVSFGEWGLTDVVTREFFYALRGGERGEGLARINLPGRCDRLDACRAADMRAGITRLLSHRIDTRVNGAGVQCDAK